ncbi:MAG: helicase, partial [Oscillospiraceae bacterium]|nr:helicase [Oscillospiraceae bacterium]
MGADDEQHPAEGGGDRYATTDLDVGYYNPDVPSGVPFYYHTEEKNELLRISDALKDHRADIAAFFAVHEGRKERGNYIRSYFNNTLIEKILSNDQRAGYRAFAEHLAVWRGGYLKHEMEEYMSWPQVADYIDDMIQSGQWLAPGELPTPTATRQQDSIAEAEDEKSSAFAISQADIDAILTRGSSFHDGKYRIYEQYLKKETAAENIKFLKKEYGTGGAYPAIEASRLDEWHDTNGISIRRGSGHDGKNAVLLRWNKIEKRIGELIAADRYLSSAEKEEYPAYRQNEQIRASRVSISQEFEAIVKEYKDFTEQIGEQDKLVDRWYLVSCGDAFSRGEKKMYARTGEGDYILPMM